MRVRYLAAAVLAAGLFRPISAQSVFLGDPFPLTNTRYASQAGRPVLRSNGVEPILFWQSEGVLRTARLQDGVNRVGHPILTTVGYFDVVWTGARFVVVATGVYVGDPTQIRILTSKGETIGDPILLPEPPQIGCSACSIFPPTIAFDGHSVLVLYQGVWSLKAMRLSDTGQRLSETAQDVTTIVDRNSVRYAVSSNGKGFGVLLVDKDRVETVLLDKLGQVTSRQTLAVHSLPYLSPRSATLASDGRDYFAVWSVADRLDSALVRADGDFASIGVLESGHGAPDSVSVVSNGSRFDVAITADSQLHVLHVDPVSGRVDREVPQPSQPHALASAAIVNSRLMIAWERDPGSIVAKDIAGGLEHIAYGAQSQSRPMIATSAADTTLVAWQEKGVRAGLRFSDGRWIENEISSDESLTAVASDGQRFLITTHAAGIGWKAYSLSHTGQLIAGSERRSGTGPISIAWNGSKYGFLRYDDQRKLSVGTMDRSGELLTPAVVMPGHDSSRYDPNPSIASDGMGFLVVGRKDVLACTNCFAYKSIFYAARFDADMLRLGASDLVLHTNIDGWGPVLTWDGQNYAVAAGGHAGLPSSDPSSRRFLLWRISSSGVVDPQPEELPFNDPFDPSGIAVFRGHVVISGSKALVFRNGKLIASKDFPSQNGCVLAPFSGGQLGILWSERRVSAPHYGVPRIMLTVLDTFAGTIPPPPDVQVRQADGKMYVQWNAVAGAIHGYRLEYRVGDNEWKELERWFDNSTTSVRVIPSRPLTSYAFRVRSFAAAGASEPSAPAVTYVGRRRAVR